LDYLSDLAATLRAVGARDAPIEQLLELSAGAEPPLGLAHSQPLNGPALLSSGAVIPTLVT